jgi:hypothetical protein
MNEELSNSAQLSQIETFAASRRVVLLGASNLSLSFSKVVELARATCGAPAEFFVAMGFGRSYGQESKFFGKKISGILQSGIWDALDRAPPRATVAIVADVGNDIAYETPIATIVAWVREALDRLAKYNAQVAINNVPIESLRTVGALRYRVLRTLLFPRCRLSRSELIDRAEALSEALTKLAQEREIPAFSGENAWYGLDPIHPRRARAGDVWQRMMGALAPTADRVLWTAPARDDAKRLRRLQADSWAHAADAQHASPPCARLLDGTTLELF